MLSDVNGFKNIYFWQLSVDLVKSLETKLYEIISSNKDSVAF